MFFVLHPAKAKSNCNMCNIWIGHPGHPRALPLWAPLKASVFARHSTPDFEAVNPRFTRLDSRLDGLQRVIRALASDAAKPLSDPWMDRESVITCVLHLY